MGETIEIPAAGGVAEAYVARFGLRPQIGDMADRIALWGYVVLAPNVFHRDGSTAELAPTADLTVPENRQKFFADAGSRRRDGSGRGAHPRAPLRGAARPPRTRAGRRRIVARVPDPDLRGPEQP